MLQTLVDEEPGVVALKEDVTGEFGRRVASICHGTWAVISGGQKQNHLDLHAYGCDGYMSTFMHFNPSVAKRYWAAVSTGDLAAATDVIERFDRPYFDRVMTMPGGFDAGIHATLQAAGLAGRWRRAPYHDLPDAEYEAFAAFLADEGLLRPV